jgi:hypothetical protein
VGVPAPDLQLLITPPGGAEVDYTKYLTYEGANQQMTITQNFGRQGDTALFPLVVEHSGALPFSIPPMSQVKLHDTRVGQTLFGGVITNPAFCPLGPNLGEFDLGATDYTFYADHATVRFAPSGVSESDRIVVDLTNGAGCGITAATTANGGFVAPGPALPQWSLGYVALSSAWRTLATQMGQVTPYGWYVDDERQLHFYDQGSALDSRVTFTTSPATAGSITEGHVLLDTTFLWENDATSLVNKVLVQGATQAITYSLSRGPTDHWLSDGYNTSWPLRYTVSGSPAPVLYVNGVDTTVTTEDSGEAPSGAWSIIANANGGYFLVAAAAPYANAEIQLWYAYEAPIIMQATDAQSIATYPGPNGGVYSEFISDSSLTTPTMALARAQQDRQEYAYAVQRVTFNTSPDFLGWVRAGYVFTLDCALIQDPNRGYAMGVNDQFLCTANTITFGEGGYRTCQITGVRL